MLKEAERRIDVPGWAAGPARRVMAALGDRADENGPAALFVGGCVRDALAGRPPGDMDIATVHPPDRVTALMARAGIKAVPTGIDHGTVTAVADGVPFEITTLRRDVETFGRRATIAFTRDWTEDARRRDFTMNTLLADIEGRVFDPLGQGLDDLEAGRVRFVGDAATRIAEDYLRILRFFRFQAAYGRSPPDAAAVEACRAMAAHVGELSRERVTQEFMRLLSVDDPVDSLRLMADCNVLPILTQGGYNPAALSRLKGDPVGRLAALADADPARLAGFETVLLLPRRDSARMGAIAAATGTLRGKGAGGVREAVYRRGNEAAFPAAVIAGIENSAALDEARFWKAPALPVDGQVLMAAFGLSAGPLIGENLRRVEAWWIGLDFVPDREACLNYASGLLKKD